MLWSRKRTACLMVAVNFFILCSLYSTSSIPFTLSELHYPTPEPGRREDSFRSALSGRTLVMYEDFTMKYKGPL